MSRKHFGTDGVRGVANKKLTPELALAIGIGAGRWLQDTQGVRRVVIGRDTRRSGTMLANALAAGLNSAGVDVVDLGVAPTPAVSFAARTGDFGLGAIISASHNPAPDNGIKFVGHDGRKLPDAVELRIEELMAAADDRPVGGQVGVTVQDDAAIEAYMEFLAEIVPGGLAGLKVAVDGANGAAYALGPEILRRLGAEIVVTGDEPGDGTKINAEGGATKPQTIQDLTQRTGAAIGIAFDGDADRAVFSDREGRLINGDRTIGIWALQQKSLGKLVPPIVVGTVMSNGGFVTYMESHGISVERAPVGDKYVAERITATGARIGGEQSGHIIFPERGPTGDGLTTMLELLKVLKDTGRDAASFYDEFENWPQVMINVAVENKIGWQDKIANEMADGEAKLGNRGRILVRASGTQPMIRVMVEADDAHIRDQVADAIVDALVAATNGHIEGRVDLTHALGD